MLILTRKLGEKIVINNNVTVEILSIDRGKIRLGIIAPKDVSIYRKELLERPHDPTTKHTAGGEAGAP